MKLAKWITVLLVVFVTGVFASQVVLYEDFEDPKFPPNGWVANDCWQRGGTNNHYAIGRLDGGPSGALSTPFILAKPGQRIKVSFKYRVYEPAYGHGYIIYGGFYKEFGKETYGWEFYSFTISNPTSRTVLTFGIIGRDIQWAVDDVEVKRCLEWKVGVGPTSLGRVKALFN